MRGHRVAAALLYALAAAAGAGAFEDRPSPEIRGVVVEYGTDRPVPGVELSLLEAAGKGFAALSSASTGADGAFRFHPEAFGTYIVRLKSDDWGPAKGPMAIATTGITLTGSTGHAATVEVTETRPSRRLRFVVSRPGRLAGQVVDRDTG